MENQKHVKLFEEFIHENTNNENNSWKNDLKKLIDKILNIGREVENKEAIIAIDISGSIKPEIMKTITSKIFDILLNNDVKKGTLVYFDDDVEKYEEINLENPNMNFPKDMNMGGTSYIPPLKFMDRHNPDISFMITDGYAEIKKEKISINDNLIWIIIDNDDFEPPYGNKVIYM